MVPDSQRPDQANTERLIDVTGPCNGISRSTDGESLVTQPREPARPSRRIISEEPERRGDHESTCSRGHAERDGAHQVKDRKGAPTRGTICSLGVLAILIAACAPGGGVSLPTWDPAEVTTFRSAASGVGTLEFTPEGCVHLVLDGGKRILLVWPVPTRLEEDGSAIRFVDPASGEEMRLLDGDRIEAGGGTGAPDYVNPPTPACRGDETFIVSAIGVP